MWIDKKKKLSNGLKRYLSKGNKNHMVKFLKKLFDFLPNGGSIEELHPNYNPKTGKIEIAWQFIFLNLY